MFLYDGTIASIVADGRQAEFRTLASLTREARARWDGEYVFRVAGPGYET